MKFIGLGLLTLGFYLPPVMAGVSLNIWRDELTSIRVLAENNVALAASRLQELQTSLPVDITTVDWIRLLNVSARINIYAAQTEQAHKIASDALMLASQENDQTGQLEAELNIAKNSVNQGKISQLVTAITHCILLVKGLDRSDLLSEAMLSMSMMYRRLGQFDESVTIAMQSMDIAKSSHNSIALTYAYQGLGISFEQSNRNAEARENFMHMLEQARIAHYKLLEADALISLGNVYYDLGNSIFGEEYLRKGIQLSRDVGAPFNRAHGLFTLAHQYSKINRTSEAISLLDEALVTYENFGNKIGLWYTLIELSSIELTIAHVDKALEDAQRAQDIAHKIGFALYISKSNQLLAKIVAANGDPQKAYKLLLVAGELNDKAANEQASARMLDIARSYQTESKQREIDNLVNKNEQQTLLLKQHSLQQRVLWTFVISSVLMLLGVVLFLIRSRISNRKLASLNARLFSSQQEVNALNADLEQRVTERTSELRQQTLYLRTLIDSLPVYIWLKDTASRFLATNQAVANICGLTEEAMVNKTDLDFFPLAQAQSFRADDIEVMQSRKRKIMEKQFSVKHSDQWLEIIQAPVIDEDGSVLGTVGFAQDISDRKLAETARDRALLEAERLAKLRSEFLAQMSHELRTPLNGILGYAQILLRDNAMNEHQSAGVNIIQQSGEHLLTLINDILDFSKIEAGKLELDLTDILLEKFLLIIANIIHIKSAAKGLSFSLVLDPNLPTGIKADEKRLRQVLLNLLSNAVKYTELGSVTLRVKAPFPERLRFEIEDTGIGIAIDQQSIIFEPFEQAHIKHRNHTGSGLGLAISRQLIRMMGSDIEIDSHLGKGSIFSFEFAAPPVDLVLYPARRLGRVLNYLGSRKLILVVDDIAENRMMVSEMLNNVGFKTLVAVNGQEALEKAAQFKPDLILMDIVMPVMDGLEATVELSHTEALKEIPIIALSASVSAVDEHRCLRTGVDAFLPKPIMIDQLLTQLARLLKLEWVYSSDSQKVEDANEALNQTPPAPEKIEELHYLAQTGNMRDIISWADALAVENETYMPFANQLRKFAKNYQSKAILRLVEQYLTTGKSQ